MRGSCRSHFNGESPAVTALRGLIITDKFPDLTVPTMQELATKARLIK